MYALFKCSLYRYWKHTYYIYVFIYIYVGVYECVRKFLCLILQKPTSACCIDDRTFLPHNSSSDFSRTFSHTRTSNWSLLRYQLSFFCICPSKYIAWYVIFLQCFSYIKPLLYNCSICIFLPLLLIGACFPSQHITLAKALNDKVKQTMLLEVVDDVESHLLVNTDHSASVRVR